ncbi:putative Zn finger protein [Paraburkholderia sp. JPY465]|uniref:SWIM zinc finger family protein n=1 Tax=Paraburkholderia sp. JPY465 TaxID=3042285 RepID=UPI003D2554AA
MSSVFYDQAQIAHWLDSRTVARARDYVHAVSKLRWQDNVLSGEVQGTARRPYTVDVQFYDTADGLWAESECSCPVGYDCKHAAALLIAGLERMPKPQPGL